MVKRRVLLTLFITVIAVAAFSALAANVSEAFIAGALLSGVIGGIAMMGIACPKCGHTVLFQKQRAFGHSWHAFTVFPIPKVCANCGHKL
jgi:hypothetical protein